MSKRSLFTNQFYCMLTANNKLRVESNQARGWRSSVSTAAMLVGTNWLPFKEITTGSSKSWNHTSRIDIFSTQQDHCLVNYWSIDTWKYFVSHKVNRKYLKGKKELLMTVLTAILLKLQDYTFDLKY